MTILWEEFAVSGLNQQWSPKKLKKCSRIRKSSKFYFMQRSAPLFHSFKCKYVDCE